jgi:hypothetical protein
MEWSFRTASAVSTYMAAHAAAHGQASLFGDRNRAPIQLRDSYLPFIPGTRWCQLYHNAIPKLQESFCSGMRGKVAGVLKLRYQRFSHRGTIIRTTFLQRL